VPPTLSFERCWARRHWIGGEWTVPGFRAVAVRAIRYGFHTATYVQHQQELDQMLLHRRDQRLDDKDVAFPAITLELHAKAIVRIWLYLRWQQRDVQVGTDFPRQKRMRATTKDGDFGQRPQPQGGSSPGCNQGVRSDCRNRVLPFATDSPLEGGGFEPSVPLA
jgi:hypothetical protein